MKQKRKNKALEKNDNKKEKRNGMRNILKKEE